MTLKTWLERKWARLKFLWHLTWFLADQMADAYFQWWERKLGKNKLDDDKKVGDWLNNN